MQQGQTPLEVRDDAAMRLAAFGHVWWLAARDGALESSTTAAGLTFQEARVPLVNPRRGTSSRPAFRFGSAPAR
jgi:hypothetical protein